MSCPMPQEARVMKSKVWLLPSTAWCLLGACSNACSSARWHPCWHPCWHACWVLASESFSACCLRSDSCPIFVFAHQYLLCLICRSSFIMFSIPRFAPSLPLLGACWLLAPVLDCKLAGMPAFALGGFGSAKQWEQIPPPGLEPGSLG